MSDRLREAIDSFRNDAAKQWLYENPKVEVLLAAARRFLALTETGPEKRWCVKHDCEGLGNADRGEIGCTGAGVGRREDMDCRLVPVFVIPADYLTEEETK